MAPGEGVGKGAAAGILAAGLVAGALAFFAAQPYPGATVDSGEYLAVAEGLLEGHGLTMPYAGYDEGFRVIEPGERVPMTQFPPGYPLTLAAVQKIGSGPLEAARAIGALCFGITVALVAHLVFRATRSPWAVVVAGGLMASADLVVVHSMAWSETVMLTALIGATVATLAYLRGGASYLLVVAGVLATVASITRFVGVSAIVAIALCLMFAGRGNFMRRMMKAAAFGLVCLVPTIAWFVRNASILGQPSEKEVGLYIPGIKHIVQMLATFGGWLVPWKSAMPFVGGALLVLAVVLAFRQRDSRSEGFTSLPRLCVLFGSVYLAFVFASRTLLDQNIAFDFRILMPVYVFIVIGVCAALPRVPRWGQVVLAIVAVVSFGRGLETVRSFSELSVASYTGETWRHSPTLRHAGGLPDDTLIITNAPDPLWIWHDKVSVIVPPRSSLYSGEPNEGYSEDLAEIHAATRCRDAVVVFFDQPTRKPRRYIEPLLIRALGLEKTHRFSDGEIYDVAEPRCKS